MHSAASAVYGFSCNHASLGAGDQCCRRAVVRLPAEDDVDHAGAKVHVVGTAGLHRAGEERGIASQHVEMTALVGLDAQADVLAGFERRGGSDLDLAASRGGLEERVAERQGNW